MWDGPALAPHPKATLILDASVSFLFVTNFLCYAGARVVQTSPYLSTDIVKMRGSISPAITHQSVTKTTFLLYFPKAGATLAA